MYSSQSTIFEDKFQMPENTKFEKSELLVSYSNFPFEKNGFLGKAYSPRCNIEPFFPIRLHSCRCHLRMEDHLTPMPAVAVTTCPMLFRGPPRWSGGGIAHTPCCLATYSLVHHHCPLSSVVILTPPRPVLCIT